MNTLPFNCQEYREAESIEEIPPLTVEAPADWLVQLKYDGIWALITIERGTASIYSKTGQLKHQFRVAEHLISRDPIVLVGEFMFGSQWSQHASRKGAVFIFDCLQADGGDLSHLPYKERLRKATGIVCELGEPFRLIPCYSIDKMFPLWVKLERENTHEGLVIRRWSSTWYSKLVKIKTCVEDDYVIMSHYEGTGKYVGMLGGFIVGQYEAGTLVDVMNVGGGYSDEQRRALFGNHCDGLVILVQGKARFSSGALRHPNFIRFRDDKRPEDCLLKRAASGLSTE